MKITLDKKILAGFIGCAFTLLVIAIISFRNSEKIIDNARLVAHTHEVLYELEQILVASVDAESGARGFVITGNENYLTRFGTSKQNLSSHLVIVQELTKDNPVQQQNIADLAKVISAHLEQLDECVTVMRIDGIEKARSFVATGESRRILNDIRGKITDAKGIEQNLMAERKKTSEQDTRNFNILFLGLIVAIAVVLIVVYFIVIINLKALRRAEADATAKNWNLTGSGRLAKEMQGDQSVTALSQAIINHIVTYLNVQAGAIYVTEDDGGHLKMRARYILDKKIEELPVIRFGEGLPGEVAAEKKSILIRNIPQEYFTVNTGFGTIRPQNVIAIPFLFADRVIGVLELGSVHEITDLCRQYLEFVVDSIAIAIMSATGREKAVELLEETQRQGEELEVQQEELRQANEELQAKTEMLERSEGILKVQREELQQTNEELEQKANMLEDQKGVLQNAKEEVENKAREVEVTSKYKSEFLANMSHELRTPLNSILILAQLLSENKNKTLGEKEIDFAKNIHNSGNDLLNLINEILDLSKVEAGKMQLDITDVPLDSITGNISAMLSEIARNKAIEFDIVLRSENLPAEITTDRQRVEQIIRNLLSNAFKFTDKGGKVTLTIDKPSPGTAFMNKTLDPKEAVAFSVTDTGIGIPENKRGIIFEAFQQADGSTKRKYGGTGLGLSISRELAFVLGGEIHLQSEEGKGSTFTLYLPLRFDPASAAAMEKPVEIKPKEVPKPTVVRKSVDIKRTELALPEADGIDDRGTIKEGDRIILIIEDEEGFARVLLDFVRERKYKGIIARQGNTGISFARHYRPDAILLDMKLPVMDGTEVLKQLKNDPELRHIPVQVISAYDQMQEGLALGAFDYIQKPVTTIDLQRVLDKIERFTSKKLKKLLIVEDNEQQNDAIRELIGNGDVKSYSAYSGSQAFTMLGTEIFDCIIVDLGLPDMTGFDLLEKIKADELFSRIPVIVYTAKDLQKEDTMRLHKLADTVVLKTADSQARLLDETTLFLHRVESRLPREKQAMLRELHNASDVLKNKKILLVDDDIRNIYSLTNALEEEGLHCITADNGKAALAALKDHHGIDLILMDVMMPEMDGYEATLEIRKMNGYNKIPIIALTAKAMKGDKEKCLAVGMSDYISKPVNVGQLLSLMRVWLYR